MTDFMDMCFLNLNWEFKFDVPCKQKRTGEDLGADLTFQQYHLMPASKRVIQ